MVLLTSSQVSVAISTAIVISCTTALFLSGYVIQQRTVRNLRAAIRPDTSPQLYLPDRFRDDTTELAGGTIVMLDEYNRPVRLKSGRISIGKAAEAPEVPAGAVVGGGEPLGAGQEAVELRVQETLPETPDARGPQQVVAAAEQPAAPAEASAQAHDAQQQDVGPPGEGGVEVQVQPQQASPLEVRDGDRPREEPAGSAPEKDEKPISRAERRRLIKEEIQRLSQGETPIYYQRRLW